MATTVVPVETPQGPGRLFLDLAEQPSTILVLGHGAGGGVGAADLELLAAALPQLGTSVVRFEQPWRTAGRKVGAPPPRLDEAWIAALEWLTGEEWGRHPLVVGGRSAGARVACRTASETNPAAIVCLAFPLHRPGRPDDSRLAELLAPTMPRLVLQGSKDSFGTSEEIRAAIGGSPEGITVVELPGADHALRIARRRAKEEGADNAFPSASDDAVGGDKARSAASGASNPTLTIVTEVSRFIAAVVGITTS
ncbi:MAG: alpha/beta family hydrolase [Propionibacteriaceae bacterium]|jgi:predicted alpha/beta-hydrolase family hydrolase